MLLVIERVSIFIEIEIGGYQKVDNLKVDDLGQC